MTAITPSNNSNWMDITQQIDEIPKIVIEPSNLTFTITSFGLAQNIESFALAMKDVPVDQHSLKHLQFLAVVSGLLSIHEITQIADGIITASVQEKIDAALEIVSNVGNIAGAVGTTADALETVGAVGAVSSWTAPLGIVSVALGTLALVVESKGLVQTHRFSVEFNRKGGLGNKLADFIVADYINARKLIEDRRETNPSFIKKYFHADEAKFAHRLMVIEANARQKIEESTEKRQQEVGKGVLQSTLKSLSERITTKKWSHKLKILAAAISLIAVGILLFSPLAPVGLGLLALGSAVSLTNYLYNKYKEKKFKEALELG